MKDVVSDLQKRLGLNLDANDILYQMVNQLLGLTPLNDDSIGPTLSSFFQAIVHLFSKTFDHNI